MEGVSEIISTCYEPPAWEYSCALGVFMSPDIFKRANGRIGDYFKVTNGCLSCPDAGKNGLILQAVPLILVKKTDTVSNWYQAQKNRTKDHFASQNIAINTYKKLKVDDLYELSTFVLMNPLLAANLFSDPTSKCEKCIHTKSKLVESGANGINELFYQFSVRIELFQLCVHIIPVIPRCAVRILYSKNVHIDNKEDVRRYIARQLEGFVVSGPCKTLLYDMKGSKIIGIELDISGNTTCLQERFTMIHSDTRVDIVDRLTIRKSIPKLEGVTETDYKSEFVETIGKILMRGNKTDRNSVYLRGPSNNGKRALVELAGRSLGAAVINVTRDKLKRMHEYVYAISRYLDELYDQITSQPTCIVVLDHCELFFKDYNCDFNRSDLGGSSDEELGVGDNEDEGGAGMEAKRLFVSKLERLIVATREFGGVVWVFIENCSLSRDAITTSESNMSSIVPKQIMDTVLETFSIQYPDVGARKALLNYYLSKHPAQPQIDDKYLEKLSCESTYGMSLSEVKEFGRGLVRNLYSKSSVEDVNLLGVNSVGGKLKGARGIGTNSSNSHVSWDDIIGLERVKSKIEECLTFSLYHGEAISKYGLSVSKGILLYGPPGNGKTMIAKAISSSMHGQLYILDSPSLVHGEVGASEKTLQRIFREARSNPPSVIFLDEIQAIFAKRDGINSSGSNCRNLMTQLFFEMDAITEKGVVVLAASNLPWSLDPSLLRAGRIDQQLYVPLPNKSARLQLLTIKLNKMTEQNGNTSIAPDIIPNISLLVSATKRYSSADLDNLIQHGTRLAFYEAIQNRKEDEIKANQLRLTLSSTHIIQALTECPPSTPPFIINEFKQYNRVRNKSSHTC